MPRLLCEAIFKIAQVFIGNNSNNCIGQVQNAYLQEIISSCQSFQQLPIFQSKEIQQFQISTSAQSIQNSLSRGENSTLMFFSNFNSSILEIVIPFLNNFSQKIQLFDRRINQDAQYYFHKLKTLSEINPKKLVITGNKENSNNTSNYSSISCTYPQAESETIAKITLSSILSFIHNFFKYLFKNTKKSTSQPDDAENITSLYFFDMPLYSILFGLLNLSIQLNSAKEQLIEALKSATIVFFELFISESFKKYNIVYPPPKKILSRITSTPSQTDNNETTTQQKEEISKNTNMKGMTFDKDEFCSILNNILSLFISKSPLFFPGLDDILVGIEKYISSDHRSELHFFDKQIIKFITHLASSIRATSFSHDSAGCLVLLASNQLLKFDKDSLDYFIALSKHNDDSSNDQIVMMLVNSLTIELPKERITNADNCITRLASLHQQISDNGNDENGFKSSSLFPEKDFLNESFRQPDPKRVIEAIVNNYLHVIEPQTSFVQEGYSALVSKPIYKIICMLSESFRKSTPMLDKLYTKFGKAISTSSSLFDSLCLFVVFYLESKSKWHFEPSTNPAAFLLLPHLFSRNVWAKKGTMVQRLQMFTIGILIDKSEANLLSILNDIADSYKSSDDKNDKTNPLPSPASPLYVLQILESLIVNYKNLVILITNSSDSILEPLCAIMNEMKRISYKTSCVSHFDLSYKDIISTENDTTSTIALSNSTNTPDFQREIDRVRYTFLVLVSLIFENNEAKKILIDNSPFTKTFLDFIFEGEKVREYILSQLESAMITSKCDPSIALIPRITDILELLCETNSNIEYVNKTFVISKEIVMMINRTLSARKDLCKSFTNCFPKAFELIVHIQKENKLNKEEDNFCVDSLSPNLALFHELIEFLSCISIHLDINDKDKEILTNSIDSFWPSSSSMKKLPNWLYSSLIKLMVPDEKLIHQPVLLHLIFHYFNNDEYLQYLCDLFDNNLFNVEKCCSVNFDQTIFQCFISDHLNFESQTLIKKLFTNIALIAISPTVVYQYLRLLSPNDSTHLNKNMNLHLNYLNELLILSLGTQHESLALNPGHSQKPVSIDLLPKMTLPKSSPKRTVNSYGNGYFTFVFWLFVEEMSPTYYPLIFNAKDEKGNIYEVFIKNRKICINSDKNYYSSSKVFNYTFNKDEWYFVSISFSKYLLEEENASYCLVTMTVKDEKFEIKFPYIQMLTGLSTFTFGGVLHENSIKATKPCLLGPFALFNMILRNDKIQSLQKQEQRFFCRDNSKDPSLCHVYQPYSYGPRQMQKNFASTIVLNVKLEVFVPLFLLIPMKFEDEKIYENYIETLINIIKHGLNFGSIVEESFYNANGFGIISFIFSQKKFRKYCNYKLYCQFYDLFLNLMTDKLKAEMIKTILLNFDLWSKIEKVEDIVQILDNWLNALFPHNLQIISQIYSFSTLLNMIIFNFGLKEDEHLIKFQYELPQLSQSFINSFLPQENLSFNEFNSLNLIESQSQMINDILFQILLFFSVQKFTFEDYVLLISYLSNSQSNELILNIKKLLLQMIILKPSPLEKIFENNQALSALHQVFINNKTTHSIQSIESTIEIIIFLHKTSMIHYNFFTLNSTNNSISITQSNLISKFSFSSLKTINLNEFSLTDHLYTIMQQIPKEIFENKEFFNCLIDLTVKASPEIFPFTCWSALCIMNNLNNNQNKEERKEMLFSLFKNIEPSHEFVTPHWSLIPVLLVIKVNEKSFADKMICFLIDCCKGDEWAGIFFTISNLCKVFRMNPMKFHRIFLTKILNNSIVKKELNSILIQITSSYIFYRDIEYDNISKFFNDSPFKLPKLNNLSNVTKNNKEKENSNINSNFLTFNLSTKICDFISQISQIDSTSLKTVFHFGLRFHKITGKWIDRDIAILLLNYISNINNNDSINFLRLILTYFVMNQNDDKKGLLKMMKDNLVKPSDIVNDSNNCLVYLFENAFENSHIKRQEILQSLIDLVSFQIEKIGLIDDCLFCNYKSENFRVNGNHIFNLISLVFDDKDLLDLFFQSNLMFAKRIQEISIEIVNSSNSKLIVPSFAASFDSQQIMSLVPFFDCSCQHKNDISKVFEVSQMDTIIRLINENYKHKHSFKDLFESITTSNGPLYTLNRFKMNGKYLHIKRDKTLIAQLIPIRMKTSWIFNDHKNAIATNKENEPPLTSNTNNNESATTSNTNENELATTSNTNGNELATTSNTNENEPPETSNTIDNILNTTVLTNENELTNNNEPATSNTDTENEQEETSNAKAKEATIKFAEERQVNCESLPKFEQINPDDEKRKETDINSSKHFSRVPSLSMNGQQQPIRNVPLKEPGSKVRRISTLMKKRLMLSSSSCFVNIDSDVVKKNCELVSIDKTEDAYLTLTSKELRILKLKNFKHIRVNYSDLKRITKTMFLHKPLSLQIITNNGKELFINLETNESRDSLYNFICSRTTLKFISFVDQVERSTRLWLDEKMPNFEYLLVINMASSRSFQNSSQYPIFPFIFSIYDQEINENEANSLLTNVNVYRDLSKPSGALDSSKFQKLKKNFNILKKVELNNNSSAPLLTSKQKQQTKAFLFSSAASNPQIVYGELARIEPFLSLYIALQGGKISKEGNYTLLSSIPSLYESVLNDMADFRELSPEFFIVSPEFLEKPTIEIEKEINFGEVALPPWSNICSLPAEFLYLHRKALESNLVRHNLNKWIDLIFGVNQRSEDNAYEGSLYEDAWCQTNVDSLKNKLSSKKKQKKETENKAFKNIAANINNEEYTVAKELEASKRVLGQVPLKIFNKPHPQCSVHVQQQATKGLNLNEKVQVKESSSEKGGDNTKSLKKILISSPQKANEAEDKSSQNLKYIKSRSSSLVSPNALKKFVAEQLKAEKPIEITETRKRVYVTSENLDDKKRKKQQSKMKQVRDSFFEIKRNDLKKGNLIYATVYSAASKTIKIHSLDNNGNRFLFVIDAATLDIIYSRSFSGEIVKATNNEAQNLSDSLISVSSFRDCLMIVLNDKTLLLDSDGKAAVNYHLTDHDIEPTNKENNQPTTSNNSNSNSSFLHLKKYVKTAYDSDGLVAIGGDSIIDFFKSTKSRSDSNRAAVAAVAAAAFSSASSGSSLLNTGNGNSSADLNESENSNQNSQIDVKSSSLTDLTKLVSDLSSNEVPYFSFADTMMMMKKPVRNYHFFSEHKVTCLAVSSFLNTLAVASSDGRILLFSLFNSSTIFELKLPAGFVAQEIIFTKSLGFIIVYGTKIDKDSYIYSLFIFTLNGELVRRRAFPSNSGGISQISSFVSKKGIDYIALVTAKDNALHVCEAFLLDFESFVPPQHAESSLNLAESSQQRNESGNQKENNEEVDSPLVFGEMNKSADNFNAGDSDLNEESLIKRQLEIPFPSLFRFDDNVVYLGYKRKLVSILYITKSGELGLIPVNKIVDEKY